MSDSRREALEAAFDQHAEEEEQTTGDEPAEGTEIPPEGAEPAEKPGKEPKSAPKDIPAKEPVPEDGEQKAAVEKPQKVEKQAPTGYKAPVSWRPEVREKFSSVPKEVQEEVLRREKEVDQTLRNTAEIRNYGGRMQQIMQPYEAMIRAEGGDHHSAVDSLLKTAYHLRTANPQQKAQMVAQMIQQHGVDVNMLDQALTNALQGKQAQMAQDPMAQYFEQRLAPLQQQLQRFTQAETQATQRFQQQAQEEAASFSADPKNEFFEDVRGIMADFIETAAKMGQKMTLQDAYARATLAHPTIGPIVQNRQMSAQAAQRTAAARRAKAASASLPSGGAPAGAAETDSKPKGRRSAIEAAWDSVENREP